MHAAMAFNALGTRRFSRDNERSQGAVLLSMQNEKVRPFGSKEAGSSFGRDNIVACHNGKVKATGIGASGPAVVQYVCVGAGIDAQQAAADGHRTGKAQIAELERAWPNVAGAHREVVFKQDGAYPGTHENTRQGSARAAQPHEVHHGVLAPGHQGFAGLLMDSQQGNVLGQ